MKVLQISNYYYPHIGGIEEVAKNIYNALGDDVEQKIICFNEDAQSDGFVCHRRETVKEIVNGAEITRCGCFTKIFSQSLSFTYRSELKRILREFVPDVVIFHYPNPFVSFLLLSLLDKKTKFILWWHLDIVKQKFLSKFFHNQSERLCQRADAIIATSPNYIKGSKYLSKYENKCRVIPNCIKDEFSIRSKALKQRAQEIKNQYKGKTICFGLGRHVEYKGFSYLIEASKYLDDSFIFLIGGKGPQTRELMKKAKGDEKIVFLGMLPEFDLFSYYMACDIFCFPSITKNEAFGIALAEAMSFEKAAVTFDIKGSGVPYVNVDGLTGLSVECKNSIKYADAIKLLASDDDLRKKYAKAAKERVNELFTFSKFEKSVCEMLEKI